jgi:hypothetical protein
MPAIESRMDMDFSAIECVSRQAGCATHPQGARRQTLALRAVLAQLPLVRQVMRLPLSLVVAGIGLLPTRKGQAVAVKPLKRQQRRSPRFALKDSDPLRAEAHVESYAASACPDAPSGASNCGF